MADTSARGLKHIADTDRDKEDRNDHQPGPYVEGISIAQPVGDKSANRIAAETAAEHCRTTSMVWGVYRNHRLRRRHRPREAPLHDSEEDQAPGIVDQTHAADHKDGGDVRPQEHEPSPVPVGQRSPDRCKDCKHGRGCCAEKSNEELQLQIIGDPKILLQVKRHEWHSKRERHDGEELGKPDEDQISFPVDRCCHVVRCRFADSAESATVTAMKAKAMHPHTVPIFKEGPDECHHAFPAARL